jgi:hypothetical protein
LYDLFDDIGQLNNLADAMPEKVEQMQKLLDDSIKNQKTR